MDEPIVGTVLIIVECGDTGRVIDQLHAITKRDDLWRYAGAITMMRGNQWTKYITDAMIYLELPASQWTTVGKWCESAHAVGLVQSYHAATVGQMRIVETPRKSSQKVP